MCNAISKLKARIQCVCIETSMLCFEERWRSQVLGNNNWVLLDQFQADLLGGVG